MMLTMVVDFRPSPSLVMMNRPVSIGGTRKVAEGRATTLTHTPPLRNALTFMGITFHAARIQAGTRKHERRGRAPADLQLAALCTRAACRVSYMHVKGSFLILTINPV